MNRILRDPRLGLVWLAARLWVGWEFLDAGWQKTFGSESSSWWGSTGGVHGFLSFAGSPASTGGAHAAVPHWYGTLINSVFIHGDRFFAVAIPLGELLVGIGLILGLFTMASAFFAVLMNLSYLLAGSTGAGLNPEMFGLGLLIMFAGSAAYVYGIDCLRDRPRRTATIEGCAAQQGTLGHPATGDPARALATPVGLHAWRGAGSPAPSSSRETPVARGALSSSVTAPAARRLRSREGR